MLRSVRSGGVTMRRPSSSMAAAASARLSTTTAPRTGCGVRPSRSVNATSASGSELPAKDRASRSGQAAAADGVRADHTISSAGSGQAGCGRVGRGRGEGKRISSGRAPFSPVRTGTGARAGASSRIACAFVPPIPNELTPASRRPPSDRGQGRSASLTTNGELPRSSSGFTSPRLAVAGMCSWLSDSAVLISDVIPAACPRWPTFPLIEPMGHRSPRDAARAPNAIRSPAISMASPRRVAVACASTYPMSSGPTPASSMARVTTSACRSALGAVKPTLCAPSLLTATARITAEIRSPSARASVSRLSTTTPAPLPKIVPVAAASKGRQWPSRLSGPSWAHQ